MIVTGGTFDGQAVVVEAGAPIVLGSAAESALRLELGNVAASHARFVWQPPSLLLTDLGSTTGTYVNGERVSVPDRALAEGDRVCLGPPGSRQSVKLLVRGVGEGQASGGHELHLGGGTDLVLESAPGPAQPPAEAPARIASIAQVPGRAPDEPAELDAPMIFLEPEPAPAAPPARAAPAAAPVPPPQPPPQPPAPPPKPPAPPSGARSVESPKPSGAARPGAPPARKASRSDYATEPPSIAPDRVREPVRLPAAAPKPARGAAKKRAPAGASVVHIGPLELPRMALTAAVAVLAAGGALLIYGWLHRPPPTLEAVDPPRVEPGGTLNLRGTHFETVAAANLVRIGGQSATVSAATETSLSVRVPALDVSKGEQEAAVVVEVHGARTASLTVKVFGAPRITTLEPDVALPGGEVTARGQNLRGSPVTVTVGAANAEVLEAQPDHVRFRVPQVPVQLGASIPVNLRVGSANAQPAKLLLGQLPLVIGVKPESGFAGQRVTLAGRGFSADAAANVVTFGNRRALVLSAKADELVAVAPPPPGSEIQYSCEVHATVAGAPSNAGTFVQMRPNAINFIPRFFASVVPNDPSRAYVSTELGPLLLLTDKGPAASPAERASQVADALNLVVDSAVAGQPPTVELREGAPAEVRVTGAAQPLLTATQADADGYSRRGRAAGDGARAAATLWAALLQDYFTLFVGGQRPSRIAELGPRGKVMLEIYAEAQRAGSQGGVGRNLVAPLPLAWESALREAAMSLPEATARGAAARAAGAIEGNWQGTLEDASGARDVQLRLALSGGRLGGGLTARSGAVRMETPISEAQYERGTLRFTAVLSGAPRQFVGTLQGATLSGTILATPGGKEAIGRFTLTFAQ